jgi:hypothetical protein
LAIKFDNGGFKTMKRNDYILKCVLLLCLPMLVFTGSSFGQVLTDVQESFKRYTQSNLQEKVYVHTDKNFYLAGEILWFKIYNVDGDSNKPLNLSKVAYVEVVDKDNNAILQAKVAIDNGNGSGSFYVPISVNTGNYKLVVYTSWMKNFSADHYFQKTISIVNPLKSPETVSKPRPESYDVQFFAEGGYLLNDVNSKVAFRVVDSKGNGVDFTSAVINERADTAAIIKPLKFGMGNFSFKPVKGHTYEALIQINNRIIRKDLPEAMTKGYNMALVSRAGGQISVSVHGTASTTETVYLFAYTRQQVKQVLSAPLVNGVANFVVNEDKLGEGVSHLTIFNSSKQPVCERLIFKRPLNTLAVSVMGDKLVYQPRKKVNIEVSAKDRDGKPLAADLSMSIFKADSLQGAQSAGIQDYIWLSSDLKGNIEQPDYYLTHKTADADEALDNLMLTQGWSGFKWADALNNSSPAFKYIPEYRGHVIIAKITDPQTGLPQKNVSVSLGVPGKRVQFYPSSSDSLGYVTFNTQNFYGANELVVQTVLESDSLLKIEVVNPFTDRFPEGRLADLHLSKNYRNLLQNYSVNVQAQNIYSGDKIRPFYNPVIDSSAFYGEPKKAYMLDDYTRFTTMEEVLREYVHEVIVARTQKKFHFKVLNATALLENNPLVLLDGIPVYDMDKIIAIDPLKVKRLELVNERYYLRPLVTDGVLSFTSMKNDLAGYEIDPHALVLDYEGMQLNRDFFSPVYDRPEQAANHLPDFRNVLYWQPNVTTDASGKATVSFYTSDLTGIYTGVLQGITANGVAGGGTFSMEVK